MLNKILWQAVLCLSPLKEHVLDLIELFLLLQKLCPFKDDFIFKSKDGEGIAGMCTDNTENVDSTTPIVQIYRIK